MRILNISSTIYIMFVTCYGIQLLNLSILKSTFKFLFNGKQSFIDNITGVLNNAIHMLGAFVVQIKSTLH